MNKCLQTFIRIRNIPIRTLLTWDIDRLERTELDILDEIRSLNIKQRQASVALKWIQGVQRVKKTKGGENG